MAQTDDLKNLQAAPRSSFMWAMMKAVANAQGSAQTSQMQGTLTTEMDTKIEAAMYNFFNGQLTSAAKYIEAAAQKGDSNGVTVGQDIFNTINANAQAVEGQQDGVVQSSQQSVQAIASDLQMIAQQVQGVNSVETTLTQMLGNIIA